MERPSAFFGSPTWIRNLLEPLHAWSRSAWAQGGPFTIFWEETEGVVRGSRFEYKNEGAEKSGRIYNPPFCHVCQRRGGSEGCVTRAP